MHLDFLTTVVELNSCIAFVAVGIVDALIYRVIFLTGPPLKMSLDWPPPPNLLGLGPPKFSWRLNHIHFARHLVVFRSRRGVQSGTLAFF